MAARRQRLRDGWRPPVKVEPPEGQAYCTKCKQCRPREAFPAEPRKKNGVSSWCRDCYAQHVKARRRSQPGSWRDAYLRNTFGITEARFDELLESQGGRCAICRSGLPWSEGVQPKNFSVDHDHTCCPGKRSCGRCVRGLLCNRCNRGLGQFSDDASVLRRAAEYLERKL